jgi:hypothetical protein
MTKLDEIADSTNFRSLRSDLPFLVGIPLFIGGFGVLFYQIYTWLNSGNWIKMSIISPFYNFWEWSDNPTNWFGLHKIIDGTPLTFGLIALSFAAIIFIEKYFPEK